MDDARINVTKALDHLKHLIVDSQRPRPAAWTEEEANQRMAAQLERVANTLQAALDALVAFRPDL